jgi:signal transduction histidine kinase
VDIRLARLGTNRLDASLAVGLTAAGLVQVVLVPIADVWVGVLFVLLTTLPIAWRRTYPVPAAVVAAAPWVVPTDGYPVLGFVVAILVFYSLGTYGGPRTLVWLVAAGASLLGAVGTLLGPEQPVAAVGAVLVVVAPVGVGQVVARLRSQNTELQRLAELLRVERRKVEEATIGSERARIAQDLHDVVGHEVTLIAIQAEAASAALKVRPERAAEPVETIRVTAHRTLEEIRSVLDVLSPEARGTDGEDLVGLSRRAEIAGIPNTVVVTGDPWPERSPASLAVNRVVRECLTNAGRHAPGQRVSVTVAWSADEVRVRASNARRPGSGSDDAVPGRGLTGIRHRAELMGGTFGLVADDRSFEVLVALPAPSRSGAPAFQSDDGEPVERR